MVRVPGNATKVARSEHLGANIRKTLRVAAEPGVSVGSTRFETAFKIPIPRTEFMAGRARSQALLVATPGSSGHVSMDAASPISSRGQSTTVATSTVGAHCLMLFEHAARRSPKYAGGRRMHLQPHSSRL